MADIPTMNEWPVAKALYAETNNQLNDSVNYRLVSFLTLTNEDGNSFAITSDSFIINYDRDDIIELGSYNNPQYWRSISHRYSRRDMMLGDIAVARFDKGGKISIANRDNIKTILADKNVKLHFVGYPEAAVTGSVLDYRYDKLRVDLSEEKGHLFLLSHEGGLTPGFSGSPVIVRDGTGFKVVGIASLIDVQNQNRSYSVPTTEVEFLINK